MLDQLLTSVSASVSLAPLAIDVDYDRFIADNAIVYTDFSDLTSMFQNLDGSGGNPSPGDPVGFVLNKAGMGGQTAEAYIAGLPELYPGTLALSGSFVDNGDGSYTNSGTTSEARFLAGDEVLEENEFYQIAFDAVTDGGVTIIAGGTSITSNRFSVGNTSGQVQSFSGIIRAENTTFDAVRFATSANCTISNISIKRIPNEHLTAPADNQRPVLRKWPVTGRRNLLDNSESLSDWDLLRVTALTDAITAPDGVSLADKVLETTDNASHYPQTGLSNIDSSTNYVCSVYAKAAERDVFRFRIGDTTEGFITNTLVDLSAGTVASGDADIEELENGWFRIQLRFTSTGTQTTVNQIQFLLRDESNNETYVGDVTKGLYLWGAQLEQGSAATPYQAVTSENDITEAGVRSVYSPDYDGVDDGLTYTFPGGAGPADCSVFFAVKTTSANGILFCREAGAIALVVFQDGSGSVILSNSGSVYIDGSLISGTRDDVHTAMADGEFHVGELRGANLSILPQILVNGYGSGNNWDGQLIGPIIVETSKLTNSLRRTIEQDLKRRAGIQ